MNRFRTIDGLRGLAALLVVLYHVDEALRFSNGEWLPFPLGWLMERGFLGVEIFFVLSGFVIPYSVRNGRFGFSYLWRFVARRSLRLDPPYWAAIALEPLLVVVGSRLGQHGFPLPTLPQVGAHVLYLQDVLGFQNIVPVFWTLCFEIQFYVGIVLLYTTGYWVRQRISAAAFETLAFTFLVGIFFWSLAIFYGFVPALPVPGIALERWFQFFLGTLVWWTVSGRIRGVYLPTAWGCIMVLAVATHGPLANALVPILTSAALVWSYRRDGMATFLSGRVWSFLGKISYSLYLFHYPISWRLARAPTVFFGAELSRPLLGVMFGLTTAVCIASSWLAWRLVEQPAMGLSKIVRMPVREKGPPGPEPPARTT
jgi:peptidoglycan/LPS O-acetylase OafA/YrhL